MEIIHPGGNEILELTEMRGKDGEPVTAAAGNGGAVAIPLEARFSGALLARILA